jgi:hypothetical protein
MNAATLLGAPLYHQVPSRLSELATMPPSARLKMSPTLSIVTPLPNPVREARIMLSAVSPPAQGNFKQHHRGRVPWRVAQK